MDPLLLKEYAAFLAPSFDADAFAHAIISRDAASSLDAGPADLAPMLAKLNFGVQDLTARIKQEITTHHEQLLQQAASLAPLEVDLAHVRTGINELESSLERLRRKISVPHAALSSSLIRLKDLEHTSSLAKRAWRFSVLARRLDAQMIEVDAKDSEGAEEPAPQSRAGPRSSLTGEGSSARGSLSEATGEGRKGRRERAMAEAALTLAEIETLLEEGGGEDEETGESLPIKDLKAIAVHVPAVQASRHRVVEEMETTVHRGLDKLDNPLLASSLQTAHNLSVLPGMVDSLVMDLTDEVARKIKSTFDMSSLSREMSAKDAPPLTTTATSFYKSRSRQEPTSVTLPHWSIALWARLESLLSHLGDVCIKIYTLEKVLLLKRDPATQISFLDEAMSVLDGSPTLVYWTELAGSLETQTKESVRTSTFLQTVLSTGYPRLLRLFQEFFERIATHTSTVYSLTQQSPETVLLLRSIQPFETLYLTRSTTRLSELVASSFSLSSSSNSLASSFSGAVRGNTAPTANEGTQTARAIVNELDAARFDPLLGKAVAKGAARALDTFANRIEALVQNDSSSTSLVGPLATPSQHINANLVSAVYQLWFLLDRALAGHSVGVTEVLGTVVERLKRLYEKIVEPLIMAIRREFSGIINKMHRSSAYSSTAPSENGEGGGGYMVELTDRLGFVRNEILGMYKVGELVKDWALDLSRFISQTYILHASLLTPLSESGKLLLTTETTTLEFSLSQFLSIYALSLSTMGDQHLALRAFRPLLFLENDQLAKEERTGDIPILILLHHVISRSHRLKLPHFGRGWTEGEYVRWLNEHGERERIEVLEGVLSDWEGKEVATGETVLENGSGVQGQEEDVEEELLVQTLRTILNRQKGL